MVESDYLLPIQSGPLIRLDRDGPRIQHKQFGLQHGHEKIASASRIQQCPNVKSV